jgi:hypothetical protein
MCKPSKDTRISRDFRLRPVGAFGTVAAHSAVIEPQVDGRLHIHMSLYGSKINPELLTRVACSPVLSNRVARWLESVYCLRFSESVHAWRQSWLRKGGVAPKAFEIEVPAAASDYEQFLLAAQKRAAITNFHSNTLTCFKGQRGKYMCRLARPAGVHDRGTSPLIITRDRMGDVKAGVHAVVTGHDLPPNLVSSIDAGYATRIGEGFRPHPEGPILWEMTRPVADCNVVETNLALAALSCSHTNASFINGEDSGDMIEEYQQAYMTKDDTALKAQRPFCCAR